MKFRKLSFQKKIYISCFALNLVLLLSCSIFFYYYTADSLRENTQDTIVGNASMLCKEMDMLLRIGDNTLKDLQTDSSLISISRNIRDSSENYFANHVSERYLFQNAFRSVLISQNLKGSISYISGFYDNVGVSASAGASRNISKVNLKKIKELESLMENTSFSSYIPPHEDYWGQGKTVFSVVRVMRDTYHRYGLLILDFDISYFADFLEDFENPDDFSIAILDEEQNFVYSSDSEQDQEHFYESCREALQSRSRTFSCDQMSISGLEVSGAAGWTFILSSSIAGYLVSKKSTLVIAAAMFFILFLITAAFLFLMSHGLTRPLKQLVSQLKNLEPGRNINMQAVSSDNEITILANAIQAFLAEIYDQNQRLTEAHRRTLQAHYDAMEAQLNPHFLYNTLSVIGMTGLSGGNTAVSDMCSQLSSLLRYSLSYIGQSVRLEQEITNAGSYLYIMKMRYEEKLEYEWELDDSLSRISLPKLILQPLVENCFHHGFQQTEQEICPPWKIRIRSFQDDTCWYLSVINNGAPFKEENLERLRLRLEQFRFPEYEEDIGNTLQAHQGFGLENTILRLNIYYRGEQYFRAGTTRQGETAVTIGGPLHPKKPFVAVQGTFKGGTHDTSYDRRRRTCDCQGAVPDDQPELS